jgi:DNA polymerase III delta prime subunit
VAYDEIIKVPGDYNKGVLTDSGHHARILGVIKKKSKTIRVTVVTDLVTGSLITFDHIVANEHLFIDYSGKEIKAIDLKPETILLCRLPQTKLGYASVVGIYPESQIADVYDISIPFPHKYCSYDGLIHHNTTTARIIIDHITKDSREDLLQINGSSQTGVDVYRGLVEEFVKLPPYSSPIKIVHIEECDYITKNSQALLRANMEQYYQNARYIMTANYPNKLMPALRSRTIQFKFEKMPKEFLMDYVKKILIKENIEYRENDLELIIDLSYPDIRETIMVMQKLVINGSINVDNLQNVIKDEIYLYESFKTFIKNIRIKNNSNINQSIDSIYGYLKSDRDVQLDSVYSRIFKDEDIPIPFKILTNKYYSYLKDNINPFMNFMSYLYECYSLYKKGEVV